jgi:hypothetical protein
MRLGFLQRRPVLATFVTGVGLAMLIAGLIGLLSPHATLDRYAAKTNAYLWLMGLIILVGSLAVTTVVASVIELARGSRGAPPADDDEPMDETAPDENTDVEARRVGPRPGA